MKLNKIFDTAVTDIIRNRSMSLTIISVMTLSYLILTFFIGVAYVSSQFIRFVETRKHIELFFNPGTSESDISRIKQQIESQNKTDFINYVSQKEAADFLRKKYSDNPLILDSISEEKLPASLEIRSKSIDDLPAINSYIKTLDPENKLYYRIAYNENTTNVLGDLLFWVRIAGIILLTFVITTIFFLSLLAVEISMKLRQDEIEIMELVGGGNLYIRLPFVIQGIIYGFIASLLSSIIILILGTIIYLAKDQSPTLNFVSEFFSDISWPQISIQLIAILLIIKVLMGTLIGGLNSTLAIWRPIIGYGLLVIIAISSGLGFWILT